jgi:serine protease Do
VSPGGENLGFAYPAQWVTELPQRVAAELKRWRELLAGAGIKMGADGQPLPSGHASLTDMQALPRMGDDPKPLQVAYQQFLLQARPRAFMITQDGHFGAVTGYDALVGQMKRCAEVKTVCAVYAVDDTVVWGQQAGTK